jgi:hypothetical protein
VPEIEPPPIKYLAELAPSLNFDKAPEYPLVYFAARAIVGSHLTRQRLLYPDRQSSFQSPLAGLKEVKNGLDIESIM